MEILLIALIVGLIVAFDYAAVRWGYDSRDDFRLKHR
jgi:hypothetical protein